MNVKTKKSVLYDSDEESDDDSYIEPVVVAKRAPKKVNSAPINAPVDITPQPLPLGR